MAAPGVEVKDNIISVPVMEMPKIKGMGETLYEKMLQNKDEIAQIDGITGQTETYEVLLQKSIRTAIVMRSKGLTSDDIISICSFNTLNCCVPFIGGLFLGIKTASLDPALSLGDTMHLIKQVSPKMIFVAPEAVKLIEDALREGGLKAKIVVFGDTTEHMKFSEFLAPSHEEKHFRPVEVNPKDTAIILFSSGTTGLSKGTCLSHYGMLGSCYQKNYFTVRRDVILTFAPMFWVSAVVIMLHSVVNAAARLVYPKFDPKIAWDLIKKYKVNLLNMARAQLIYMCKNRPSEDVDTSSLRIIFLGGGSLSKEQALAARKCLPGTFISFGYGQTELSGGGTIFRLTISPEDLKLAHERPNSAGRPVPGSFCKVVNPDTEEILGPNQEGELRVKTEFQMNGYHNLDSSSCWDSDGFMKTGDIAYYDEDYCFYIIDRIKETFKFQSFQVSPIKLENIVLKHPAVQAATIIGLPHPDDGNHPMGLVVLKESGVGSVSAEEIEKYVEERVDDRERLRGGVKIVKSIPVTPSGKINRRNVKNLVLRNEI